MKVKPLRFCFVIIAIFFSCTKITGGIVIAKRYVPEQTSIQMTPIYTGKSFMTIPRPVHFDEIWTITIRSITGGKEHRRNLKVTQAVFRQIKIGDFFDVRDAGGEP